MCHKNMSVSLFYIFVTSWAWKFKNIKGTSFISTHTHIQGCIIVLYKSLLSWAKGMFSPFVWIFILFKLLALHKSNNGSIDLCNWGLSSLGLICIASLSLIMRSVFYCLIYHTCQVKLKRLSIIIFQAHCTQTQALIHLHTSLQKLDIGFLSKFS